MSDDFTSQKTNDRPTIPLRNPRGLDPTLSDVIRAALRDGREVSLAEGESYMEIRIDGEKLVEGLAWESFEYPLHRGQWGRDERSLIDELLRLRQKRRAKSSVDRAETDSQEASEGVDL